MCNAGPDCAAVAPFFFVFIVMFSFFAFAGLVLKIFLWWRIFSKAGYSGAIGFLLLAPFGSLILLCILAFSKWPITNAPQTPKVPNMQG